MATRYDVYECAAGCGDIVEVLRGGSGKELTCCGEPMKLLRENTTDAAVEKHVPVVEKTQEGLKVQVGSTLHPMQQDHWIEWIEMQVGGRSYFEFLSPGDQPIALFCIEAEPSSVTVREHCNLHGLWKA